MEGVGGGGCKSEKSLVLSAGCSLGDFDEPCQNLFTWRGFQIVVVVTLSIYRFTGLSELFA